MTRALACVLLAACSKTSSPPLPSSGSSAVAPPADPVWTGTDGDVLVRVHGGVFDGACGRLGTVSGTTFTYAGGSVDFAAITAKNGVYTLPGMSFHAEVAASGAVTMVYRDGSREPTGVITGAPAEATIAAMIAARVIAPPPRLVLAVDGAPVFHYDDGRVDDAHDHMLYDDKPPFDEPFWVAADAKVVHSGDHFDVDLVAPKDSYRALHYTVTEKPLGTLAFGDKAFATIPDRAACKAEDHEVAALLRAFLLSEDGFRYLREHDLPEPLPPPPPPPPRPQPRRR